MRILICGGREFANQEKFDQVMEPFEFYHIHFHALPYSEQHALVVIHGACGWPTMKGADAMADRWALSLGLVVGATLIRRPAELEEVQQCCRSHSQ